MSDTESDVPGPSCSWEYFLEQSIIPENVRQALAHGQDGPCVCGKDHCWCAQLRSVDAHSSVPLTILRCRRKGYGLFSAKSIKAGRFFFFFFFFFFIAMIILEKY